MVRFLLLTVLFFYNCDHFTINESSLCEMIAEKTNELILDFYLEDDFSKLDSALIYINEGIENCKDYERLFSLRKLGILSLRQNFSDALLFIEKSNDSVLIEKNFLFNRFLAMQAQFAGDMAKRNAYLKEIIKDLDMLLASNDKEIKSLLTLTDVSEILNSSFTTTLMQYYYYKSILEGSEYIKSELDLHYKNRIISEEFFDIMTSTFDEDFLVFIGF
jgi:hypothetical protein